MGVQARCLMVLLAALGCGGGKGAAGPKLVDGDWVTLTLPLLDGGELELATWRGEPVVVHFFTTSSLAAQVDFEELRAARRALPSLRLLGVGLDPAGYKLVAPFRDAAGIDWAVALPTEGVVAGRSPFGDVMGAVPSTFLLDRQGRIRWEHRGQLPRGSLERALRELEKRRARD
jgi:peroxiredoxin